VKQHYLVTINKMSAILCNARSFSDKPDFNAVYHQFNIMKQNTFLVEVCTLWVFSSLMCTDNANANPHWLLRLVITVCSC